MSRGEGFAFAAWVRHSPDRYGKPRLQHLQPCWACKAEWRQRQAAAYGRIYREARP